MRHEAQLLQPVHVERCILLSSNLGLSLETCGLDMAAEDAVAKLHEVAARWILFRSVSLDR